MTDNGSTGGMTFEEALAELERTVRDLEDGKLGLEESLMRYEQGVGLVRGCHTQLRSAEQKILLLAGSDDDQQPILQPFKLEATAVTRADGARRPRKRPDE
jgi:exodeoxyribonuclease VII small subunit